MLLTISQPQQAQSQTTNNEKNSDRLDGQFDSSIGLTPQSQNPEYLKGYYHSGYVPF